VLKDARWQHNAGKQPMGNVEYLSAFEHVVMPIARQFDPELVIVSAGFDAADGDRIGGYAVTAEGMAWHGMAWQAWVRVRVHVLVLGMVGSADDRSTMLCTLGYAHMTHQLMQLAKGRVVLSLEGGYDCTALSTCATACLRTLLGMHGAMPSHPACPALHC
jgi:histone deacetylase 6